MHNILKVCLIVVIHFPGCFCVYMNVTGLYTLIISFVTRNDKVRSINRQKSRSSSLKIQRYKISGLCPTDFRSR